MRLNVFIAQSSGLSRRAADKAIEQGRVLVNNLQPVLGQQITEEDIVALDGKKLTSLQATTTIMLHKPVGYVCSRAGQGGKTVYDLLPASLHGLKPIGRLDKNSSGLLLLTNNGKLAHELTHPSQQKTKVYHVRLDKPLAPLHQQMISDYGVNLEDGPSKFMIQKEDKHLIITMQEGRNRQIRRTFAALGYHVTGLHRIQFGNYRIGQLATGEYSMA